MNIYEPMVDRDYEWINCVDGEDYEIFATLDGSPRAKEWTPIRVIRVRMDERSGFKPSDFPWLGADALIMRRAAMEALRDILEANGEILPLSTDDGVELVVFNARVIDALDEAKSSLLRFRESNRIMDIKKLALVESAIVGADLFRLPHRGSSTYVTDRFVERVTKAGLRGLKFNKVWSSR